MQRATHHRSLKVALAVLACAIAAVFAAFAAAWFGLSIANAFTVGEALAYKSRGTGIAAANQQTSPVAFWVLVGMWSVAGLLSAYLSAMLALLAYWLTSARLHLAPRFALFCFRRGGAKNGG